MQAFLPAGKEGAETQTRMSAPRFHFRQHSGYVLNCRKFVIPDMASFGYTGLMKPIRIGLIGYEGIQALDLIGPSDAFSMAMCEDEARKSRPIYEVVILGLTDKPFRAESGVLFQPHTTLRRAPALDTLIIPGGTGSRVPEIRDAISNWIAS